jgi:hypothetical protein
VTPDDHARAAELRDRRRAKRTSSRNRMLLAIAIAIAFVVGIALGQALHDNPRPGGEQTVVHTNPPLTTTNRPLTHRG